jgi:hypothetical protein
MGKYAGMESGSDETSERQSLDRRCKQKAGLATEGIHAEQSRHAKKTSR